MSKTNTQVSNSGFNYISKSSYFESKHKSRPAKFNSIEEGRFRRAERKSLQRKSVRISTFDHARNMSPLVSPVPVTTEQGKTQRRRELLQKWKEEKDKKKQEEANKKKKKPFIVGTVRAPLTFQPPPPPKPAATGRVTRSQSAKNKQAPAPQKNCAPGSQGRVAMSAADFFAKLAKLNENASFAPPNAEFHPPKLDLKSIAPAMITDKNAKNSANDVKFDPIVNLNQTKVTKSQPTKTNVNKDKKVAPATKASKRPTQPPPERTLKKFEEIPSINVRTTRQTSKLNEKTRTDSKSAIVKESNKLTTVPSIKVTPVVSSPKKKEKKDKATPKNGRVTPKRKSVLDIPKSESEVEERLRTPEDKIEKRTEVIGVSPCVTVSRGKKNARRETINKIKEGCLSEGTGDGKTAGDFRNQLNSEITRLTLISDEWEQYSKDNVLPEHIQELLLAAVGQTRLLMSKKLQQFSQLVEMCDAGRARPEGVVTTGDLQGFWDMLFMQVEDVDMRYKKLSDLREKQWVEEEQKPQQKKKTVNVKKKVTAGPSSQIRAMIEAARKAAQSQKPALLITEGTQKHFEAGFFSVTSPVREASPRTPLSKQNMLKDVLSAEAKKANSVSKGSASRAMLMASLISKNMDNPTALSRISPAMSPLINLEATPARSILKTPQQKSTRKSVKTVLFQDKASPSNDHFTQISYTPDKKDIQEDEQCNSRGRTRKSKADQENLTPNESPPRRMTRQMRRSILQEKDASAEMQVEILGRNGRKTRSTRSSGHATEVH